MYKVRDPEWKDMYPLADGVKSVWDESIYAHLTFNRDKTANLLSQVLNGDGKWFLRIIVDEDDNPVGGLLGRCQEESFTDDLMAWDVSMLILKEHRGRCLREFVQVVNEFKDWAVARGAKLIKIGVSSGIKIDSVSAMYEKLGFQRIGAMHGFRVGV